MRWIRVVLKGSACAALAGLLASTSCTMARAAEKTITPSGADDAAAKEAKRLAIHSQPANTPVAQKHGREITPAASSASAAAAPFQSGGSRYPGDLSYQGGAVMTQAESHAIYVLNRAIGCTNSSCWGRPESFLRDLAGSQFIHIVDPYVGVSGNNRYTVGENTRVSLTLPKVPLTDANILSIVHAVASENEQTGYGHIYHVFLPPGTDECFNDTFTHCYSPDNPNTFFFCAYHGSVDFKDIGHVLYSVEPYQNVSGCNVAPNSPNGQLVDSTASILSHELIEAITDPDGTGWWNTESNALFGNEIADECSFLIFLPSGVYFDPPAFNVGGKTFAIQSEYDNSIHACTTVP